MTTSSVPPAIALPTVTERLGLRALTESDAQGVFEILGHKPTTQNVSWGQPTLATATQWLGRRIANQASVGFSMWGVEQQDVAGLVGLCGFFPADDPSVAELGYVVHADHWGRGWGTEAAGAAVSVMVASGRRVVATIRPDNHASLRVAEKIGLIHAGHRDAARGQLLVFQSRPRMPRG